MTTNGVALHYKRHTHNVQYSTCTVPMLLEQSIRGIQVKESSKSRQVKMKAASRGASSILNPALSNSKSRVLTRAATAQGGPLVGAQLNSLQAGQVRHVVRQGPSSQSALPGLCSLAPIQSLGLAPASPPALPRLSFAGCGAHLAACPTSPAPAPLLVGHSSAAIAIANTDANIDAIAIAPTACQHGSVLVAVTPAAAALLTGRACVVLRAVAACLKTPSLPCPGRITSDSLCFCFFSSCFAAVVLWL